MVLFLHLGQVSLFVEIEVNVANRIGTGYGIYLLPSVSNL